MIKKGRRRKTPPVAPFVIPILSPVPVRSTHCHACGRTCATVYEWRHHGCETPGYLREANQILEMAARIIADVSRTST